jgi:hypothetical protein
MLGKSMAMRLTGLDKHAWADSVHQRMKGRIDDLYTEFNEVLKQAKKSLVGSPRPRIWANNRMITTFSRTRNS